MALTKRIAVTIVKTAGSNRLIRLTQKFRRLIVLDCSISDNKMRVIKNPDITKKTVTPSSPPLAKGNFK